MTMTKQQKGGATTAARAGARSIQIAMVVAYYADKNRGKPWKSIRHKAADYLGISDKAIEKNSLATQTFRWTLRKFTEPPYCDRPYFPPGFNLFAYLNEDVTSKVADRRANLTPEQAAAAMEWLESLPAMGRGRKPRPV